MRLTKIYTKVGDKGTTLLANGERIAKDHIRIESYGTVDELNSYIGLLRDELSLADAQGFQTIDQQLACIQNEIFDLGAELATPAAVLNTNRQQVIGKSSIERLEREMDEYNEGLTPLANFVLPGGHRANSIAHLCRTVCRRAERHIVALSGTEEIRVEPIIYLNRLSDWFFLVSRVISKRLQRPEVLWQQAGKTI